MRGECAVNGRTRNVARNEAESFEARFAHVVFIPCWEGNVWKARPRPRCSLPAPYSLEYSEMLGEQVEKSRKEGRKEEEFRARLERRYHGLKSETRRDETRRGEEDWNKKAGRNTLGFG